MVFVFCFSSAKDCCPCLLFFGTASLFPVSVCKGLMSLLPLFVCRGPLVSLFPAIRLQRTAELVSCFVAKDCCLSGHLCLQGLLSLFSIICLEGVSSLFLQFVPIFPFDSKECCPCFLLLVCKETAVLVFHSFVCKGLVSW